MNENVPPSPERNEISTNAKKFLDDYFKLNKKTLDLKKLSEMREINQMKKNCTQNSLKSSDSEISFKASNSLDNIGNETQNKIFKPVEIGI